MNHQEVELDNYETRAEKKWMKWINSAEKLFGKSLDGNQQDDGYSINQAYLSFTLNATPEEYIQTINL